MKQIAVISFSFLFVLLAASFSIYYGGRMLKAYLDHNVILSLAQMILVLFVLWISTYALRIVLRKIAP